MAKCGSFSFPSEPIRSRVRAFVLWMVLPSREVVNVREEVLQITTCSTKTILKMFYTCQIINNPGRAAKNLLNICHFYLWDFKLCVFVLHFINKSNLI